MKSITLTLLVLFVCITAHGQTINSGSTGVDNAFNPPSQVPPDTVVTGGNAQGNCTQNAPCIVTVPLRPLEPGQAIHANGPHVFNFTTVNIGPFVTVRFTRNIANTPVIILAQGDVTIAGQIDVSGENASFTYLPKGGPGGFNGGTGNLVTAPTFASGAGGGPGGGDVTTGSVASFAGGSPPLLYGTGELRPLIGGSGGSGGPAHFTLGRSTNSHGAGGGGAIMIASSGMIDLSNGPVAAIRAVGGDGRGGNGGQAGSGGAIRLVATVLRGSRPLDARAGFIPGGGGGAGGDGRIRLEGAQALQYSYSGTTTPQASVNVNPIFGQPIIIFPPIVPTVRIVSIGGKPLPAQATADVNTPDIGIPTNFTNPVPIVVEGTNVPSGTTFEILVSPQFGSGPRTIVATGVLLGNPGQVKTATVNVNLPFVGVGIISAVIRTPIVPEPSGSSNP